MPNTYGPRATRVASLAVFVALVPAVVAAAYAFSYDFFVLLGYLGYVVAYTPFATRDRGTLFYGFIIDGEHIFLAALVALVEYGV